MNQIYDPPNDYDAGLDFDYAVWTANTQVTLTNVPWNNDYRDVVYFDTTDDLNRYIDKSKASNLVVDNLTYAKIDQPIILSQPFNQLNRYNYVRVFNPSQPIAGDSARYFYYFITSVTYVAPNTTAITVQLDTWQTYIRGVRFGRCYIERGHIGIANENNFRSYGAEYLTVPEGLDTGDSYRPVARVSDGYVLRPEEGRFSILVAATGDFEATNFGNKDDPNFDTAKAGTFHGLPSGAAYYIFLTRGDFTTFVSNFRDKPWMTQSIISITAIPQATRYFTMAQLGAKLPIGAYRAPRDLPRISPAVMLRNFRETSNIYSYIPPRYRGLRKFWTFPYMAIELTNQAGQSSIHKPELLNKADIVVNEEASLMPPAQRLQWWLNGYKSLSSTDPGIGYDHAVNVSDLPKMAILNDGAILAMANNAHSMAYGYQAADWSQEKALRGAQASYDNAWRGIEGNRELNENDLAAQRRSLGIGQELTRNQMLTNIGGATVGGAIAGAPGGPGGAAAGAGVGAALSAMNAVGQVMQMNANQQQYNSAALSSRGAVNIGQNIAGDIANTNNGLAQFAAKGDYESAIAAMNARTRDMQLTPPSTSGQVGGELLNVINYRFGYEVRILMPDIASIQAIGEIWLRYGYAVQRFGFIPQNLKVMTKFSYWKLKETFIRSAAMTEMQKQTIRGILEKGVTVYSDPDDIGMIDTADNKPLDGIAIDGYEPPDIDPEPNPEPPIIKKRRKHNMITISSVDDNPASPGNVYVLAGASPGTDANWIEKRDGASLDSFLDVTGQEQPYGVTWADFQELKAQFLSPVQTQEIEGDPA